MQNNMSPEIKKDILCAVLKDLQQRVEWNLTEVISDDEVWQLLAPLRARIYKELDLRGWQTKH